MIEPKVTFEIPKGDSISGALSLLVEEMQKAEVIEDERVKSPLLYVLDAFRTVLHGYRASSMYAKQAIMFTSNGYDWDFDPYLENTITARRFRSE